MKSGNSSRAGSAPRKKKVTAEAQSPVSLVTPASASPVLLASQVSPVSLASNVSPASTSFASASESFASASESFASASESFASASESFPSASESFASASESFASASESFLSASESFLSASASFLSASASFLSASASFLSASASFASASASFASASASFASASASFTSASASFTSALASPVLPASASPVFPASASPVFPSSPSPVFPVSALSTSSSSPSKEEEKEYGRKLVYLPFIIFRNPDTWIEVNPYYSGPEDENHQDCFSVRRLPKMKAKGRLSKISGYGTAYIDHKVYFVGGFYTKFHYRFSNKIFIYHLISKKWEEAPFKLNVARGVPIVVIVGKLLYIFGGTSYPSEALNKDNWIECCDLDNEKPTCEFLPTTSAPPDEFFPPVSSPPNDFFDDVPILYHFVYESSSQIVFSLYEAGFYSFNYHSKTWAPRHGNIKNYASVKCFGVVVIGHILFWHYYGVIYAYDLFNDCILLSHPVTEQHMSFGDPVVSGPVPDYSFLVRVGNDTLLLICWDGYTKIGKHLHFYKYRIERPPLPYHLSLIGCGLFTSPGDAFGNDVLVL